MPFQPIKRILPAAVRRLGIDAPVSATRVCETAKAALARIWGQERAASVNAVSFADGELVVRASSSSDAALLRTIAVPWINETNRALGERKVLKIRAKGIV